MRAAIHDEDGLVVNVIECDDETDLADFGAVELVDDRVGPGWRLVDGEYVAPEAPPTERSPLAVLEEAFDALLLDTLMTQADQQAQIDALILEQLGL